MTTQNLEYSEDVKAFPVVKGAFDARDDIQEKIDEVAEARELTLTALKAHDEILETERALLAIADDKLAMAATMAQDQIDAIEKVEGDHCDRLSKTKATVLEEVERLICEFRNDINEKDELDNNWPFECLFDGVRGAFGIPPQTNEVIETDGT